MSIKKFFAAALSLVVLAVALAVPAYAASGKAKNIEIYYTYESDIKITVKSVSSRAILIEWDSVPGARGYSVALLNNGKRSSAAKTMDRNKTNCRIGGIKEGGAYVFRLYTLTKDANGKLMYKTKVDAINVLTYTAAPAALDIDGSRSDRLTLSWPREEGASGYILEYFKEGEWYNVRTFPQDKLSCVISELEPQTPYTFRLCSFRETQAGTQYSRYICRTGKTAQYTENVPPAKQTAETAPVKQTTAEITEPAPADPEQAQESETITVTTVVPSYSDSGITINGANMIYTGECFDYSYYFNDGKAHADSDIVWSVSGSSAKVDEDGKVIALAKGDVTLTVQDKRSQKQGSLLIHCVSSAADVNFVPMVNGIPIANKTYPLPSWYDPGVNQEMMAAYNKLKADAAAQGLSFWIISDYRSYEKQKYTYNYWVNIYGKAEADRVSARPGYSEHQLGLAIDVNSCYNSFADTKEGKWLAANCYKYGFILRYPSYAAEKYTGYAYEPWHIRYLGTDLAYKVTQSGLTLEQYLGIDSEYRS